MPSLTVDLTKITHNTSLITELLKPHGVRLTGVTKACLGNELVGQAMLAGGAAGLADSRAKNIRNLRRHFPDAELTFLRSPVTADDSCFDADIYFVSSLKQAQSLLRMSQGGPLKLCLMLETGDGREGVPLQLASDEAARIAELPEAVLVGLATNTVCARKDVPVDGSLKAFNEAAQAGGLEAEMLHILSVGGSGLLQLLAGPEQEGEQPPGWDVSLFAPVTDLRCGEAILLGRIPSGHDPGLLLPGAHRDAFVIDGPVLEVFEKDGLTQALVGLGVQDTGNGGLIPCNPGIAPATATSDYLAVNCASPELRAHPVKVGETVRFLPTYYALLAAMTSPYIEKNFI